MELLAINWSNTFVVVGFGFAMVLVILILLVFLLLLFEKTMSAANRENKKKEVISVKVNPVDSISNKNSANGGDISEDDLAAISTAIFLYFDEIHDKESNIITIKRIERRYSPWNSKIYGITPLNK
ncbi:MAG: OadG family protein [Prevotellaceae bacterium]|jgi:Na+-transporting methylmalonyl-CoA/oxaloacetate decarboxylase gamma subunit|nr:OadG family protein [Prevotellaceae bacterium]